MLYASFKRLGGLFINTIFSQSYALCEFQKARWAIYKLYLVNPMLYASFKRLGGLFINFIYSNLALCEFQKLGGLFINFI